MGLIVVGSSQDLGSGLNFNRSGLQAVLEAARAGDFQILLVDSVSRIGRDTEKMPAFIHLLQDCGVQVYSPLEGHLNEAFQFGTVSQKSQ